MSRTHMSRLAGYDGCEKHLCKPKLMFCQTLIQLGWTNIL